MITIWFDKNSGVWGHLPLIFDTVTVDEEELAELEEMSKPQAEEFLLEKLANK